MDTTNAKKNIGQIMLDFLAAKGRATRQAGKATTEELAEAAGVSLKDAYCRLWWLAKKEGRLEMVGKGKTAVWRSAKKTRNPTKAGTDLSELETSESNVQAEATQTAQAAE